jgi:hypothetical protein
MYHTRDEVISRTIEEFERLDMLVAHLSDEQWSLLLLRPLTKDPWTVKDVVAHIAHWKADIARSARGLRRPPPERGLETNEANHLIYLRWHDRTSAEVLDWHRQVQEDVLVALRSAPDSWFSSRERKPEWPYDLEGHSAFHRQRDIERALAGNQKV